MDRTRRLACLSSGWRKSSASRPRAAAGEARAEAAASTSTRLPRGRLEVDSDDEGFAAQQQRKATGWEGSVGPEMRPGAQAGEAAMPMNREQGLTAGGDVRAAKNLLVLKGEPHRRPIFAGEGARRWPAATRSRGQQEVGREGGTGARGVEDCGGCC